MVKVLVLSYYISLNLICLEDNKSGCRFITVDAYHDAIPFYQNNDFQHLKREESDTVTRLLYFDLNDIA